LPLSEDTQVLEQQLSRINQGAGSFDAGEGGTTFRFLLAVLAVHNQGASVTGSTYLLSRPHSDLLEVLNQAGFHIESGSRYTVNEVADAIEPHWKVNVDVSSQFASALVMIAPAMEYPITIELMGNEVSAGYLQMTVLLMQSVGISVERKDNYIYVQPFMRSEESFEYSVESDWSGLSYFVSIALLSKRPIKLNNVHDSEIQPDRAIMEFGKQLGVAFRFHDNELEIVPDPDVELPASIVRDYTHCPDIALTEIVCCHALGINLKYSGIDHLTHKESDRLSCITAELDRFDRDLPMFQTHNDHRIAMSLAPLAILKPINLDHPEVVSKSFPDFWDQLEKLGFHIEPNNVSN
ncbi:MAG: hypothetical protein JJ975_05110, partial [Bacteroidia bacterium]|nr:hypothetical protein [Bacteroidia bacterium]